MRDHKLRIALPALAALLMVLASAVTETSAQEVSAEDLRNKPWQTWNQVELAYGFAHYDEIVPARVVRAGDNVRPLEQGPPLPRFAEAGSGAREVEQFMNDQQVAGLLVLHDGRIRLERYALGHSREGLWTSQSVGKSVTSTLVGIAVREGYISNLEDPITAYIEGLSGSAYDQVTVRELLTMTTGVRWNEDYNDERSDDLGRMYATPPAEGLSVAASYLRTLPRERPAGERWAYNTGETHLLGDLVRAATGRSLSAYLSEKIWKPYGMEGDASWLLDRTGSELGGCCIQARLRDFARYGQLVLDGATIDGAAIVPEDWFAAATTSRVERNASGGGYGYQWWTFGNGTFSAIGIHGQLIHIDPARRLVVVISSASPEAVSAIRGAAQTDFIVSVRAALDREAGSGGA